MLNCIMRLQAVLKILTNKTIRALNLLAIQNTKMHNAICQNCLALDYLLASEGGVCGKFNPSNCCLQIDDKGKVIEGITDKMRKLAHVPVQAWRGWDPNDLFGGWFSALGGFKTLIGTIDLILGACLTLPFLATLVLQSIKTVLEAITERKTAAHVMILWKYKLLDQDHAL
jgi:hypothetical protein